MIIPFLNKDAARIYKKANKDAAKTKEAIDKTGNVFENLEAKS